MRPLDELAEALAKFQAEVPVVPKKQTAKIQTDRGRDYSYTYADLADITAAAMPILAKHGLSFTALPTSRGDRPPVLRGVLLHTSGQRVTGELPITGRTPQEIGSSLTYGRRYLFGCLTGVVTDDDEDGQLATRAAKRGGAGPEAPVPVAPPAPPIQRRPRARPGPTTEAPRESPHGPPGPLASEAGHESENKAGPTDAQRRALFGAVGKYLGPKAGRDERLAFCSRILGRPVASSTDLDAGEVAQLLDWLEAPQPTPDNPVVDVPLPDPSDPEDPWNNP